MSSVQQTAVPRWLQVVVWSVASVIALAGIAFAVVSNSFWPLVSLTGLAVPMLPVPPSLSFRRSTARSR